MKLKIIIAMATLVCGTALAEVDQKGCTNTAKKGYVCKAQSAQTWEHKRKQKERADKRETKNAHDKKAGL